MRLGQGGRRCTSTPAARRIIGLVCPGGKGCVIVTTDDVAKLVTDRLAAVAAVGSAVPGGIAFARAEDEPSAYPDGAFRLEAAEAQVLFESLYFQAWRAEAEVFCPIGLAGVDPQAVQTALHTALASDAANTAFKAASLRNATEKVLQCRPVQPAGDYTDRLRAGKDVFRAAVAVELLVQGDKSVS